MFHIGGRHEDRWSSAVAEVTFSLAVKAYVCLQLSCVLQRENLLLYSFLLSLSFFLFSSEIQFDLIGYYGIFGLLCLGF